MNIIVTGGAGFIGQNLCKKLLSDSSNKILCLDNFSTGDSQAISEISQHSDGMLQVLNADVSSEIHPHRGSRPYTLFLKERILDMFPSGDIDEIYHLACPASPSRYQVDPVKTLLTSVIGTRNMLEIATDFDAKILFTSTSEIYGDPEVSVQSESYKGNVNCTGPRACYDEGKRAGETLCFDYNRTSNTKIKVVRIFNTYGPGMQPDDGRVVSNFVVQTLKNEDLTIYGDGSQTRSFCFVDDMVNGLMAMMATPEHITGPINLGNPTEITVEELANTVLRHVKSDSRIVYKTLPVDDPKKRKPDITKARTVLGWTPKYSLHDALPETIKYFYDCVRGA